MKYFIFLLAILISGSAYCQSFEAKLKSAVMEAEVRNFVDGLGKRGDTIGIKSVQVEILGYKIIQLRNWWKELAGVHRSFERSIDSINAQFNVKSAKKEPNEMAEYFEKKYSSTPETVKAYEVTYKVDLTSTDPWRGNHRERLRMVLNMKDLSEVRSFDNKK